MRPTEGAIYTCNLNKGLPASQGKREREHREHIEEGGRESEGKRKKEGEQTDRNQWTVKDNSTR